MMTTPDVRGWINRMLDRIALLAPRLATARRDGGDLLFHALRDLRTGVAIGELRQLRLTLPAQEGQPLAEVLSGVARHYRGLDPDAPQPAEPALLTGIDHAVDALSDNESAAVRRQGLLALVSLRRNLFPAGPAYRRMAA
jgi:uncharacterized membrane protein YccC